MFHQARGMLYAEQLRELVIRQMEQLQGVTRVNLSWKSPPPQESGSAGENGDTMGGMMNDPQARSRMMSAMPAAMDDGDMQRMMEMGSMPYRMADTVQFTMPRYDPDQGGETVSLISEIKDGTGKIIGRLEVVLRFDYLIDTIEATGWWRNHKALLVDNIGRVLSGNLPEKHGRLAEDGDPLEQRTMYAIMAMPYGTIFGKGFPPSEISSFYKLQEAPWSLVIIAPGREVLEPILHFRLHYLAVGAGFILVILVLIRQATRGTAAAIRKVAGAAERVAAGQYGISLPVKSRDEVGELTRSFNRMVIQLEERARMKTALNLAMELQQNLLPGETMAVDALKIAGSSLFCDETGGDYYDFFRLPELGQDRVVVAVGDVSGHGVAAALLMATARALIRSSVIYAETLGQAVTHANRLLCLDTAASGDFMTLLLMVINVRSGKIHWVRAGHDPAILYDPVEDRFTELSGSGIALGVDESHEYTEYSHNGWGPNQILLITTDGLWETQSPRGERFGKGRLRQVLYQHRDAPAEDIVSAITEAVDRFRENGVREDDLTLVVLKQEDTGRVKTVEEKKIS
jgi:sigma-B regulation protein RsbU (phosphoserine phosphatase)